MKKRTLKGIQGSLSVIASLALIVGTFGFALGAVAPAAFAATAPTTTAATNITMSDATLNGTNGSSDATDSSFWVSTSTFSTASSATQPAGTYSTIDLGPQGANAAYSAQLSSATGLPTVTPDTTYYYAAWSEVAGTWSPGSIMSFTTVSAPTITNISPASGSTAGGDAITITGTDFNSGASVTIGGAAATDVVVASSTAITAMTPAGTVGPQDVVVNNTDGGTGTSTGGFTYVTPVATSPTTVPATAITSSNATLNGLNGSAPATDSSFWVSTSTFSTASDTLPPGVYSTADLGAQSASGAYSAALSSIAGILPVTPSTTYYFAAWSSTDGGTTWTPGMVLSFSTSAATATAPTVTSISPMNGTTAGGTSVTITGTGFTGATAVDFGSMPAMITATTSSTSIIVTSPATTTAGIVNITVTTPGGTSATSSADQYTYELGGTVTGGTQPGGTLAVTSITPVQTSGTADGTYADGWSYMFDITVPTSEPNLSMEFSNWLDSASDTIPVAGNMQISSAQAADSAPVTITAANTFSSPPLDMIGNLSTSTPGLHVQVLVQVKIPQNTVNGSYTTNYGVQTLP